MRSLLLTDNYLPHVGGSRIYYHHLYNGMPKDSVVVLTNKTSAGRKSDRKQPFPIHRVNFGSGSFRIPIVSSIVRYAVLLITTLYLVIRYRISITHCGEPEPCGVIGLLMKAIFGIPYIMYVHDDPEIPGLRWYPGIMRYCYRKADGIIAACSKARDNVRRYGVGDEKIRIIRTTLDKNHQALADPSIVREKYSLKKNKVIMTVSRLVEEKGHEDVIKLLPEIIKKVPNVVYLVVGKGPDRKRLQRITDEQGLSKHVLFAGHVPAEELPSYYAACDLFIMLNKERNGVSREGLGMVFLEASAQAKPVIGSDSGGTADAIQHGKTGYRISLNDRELLAKTVVNLLTDNRKCSELGSRGREYVLKYFADWRSRSDELHRWIKETCDMTWRRYKDGKCRILYIIDKLSCAGTQKQLIELLKHIDHKKYALEVCCLLPEGEWTHKVRKLGITVHVLGLKKIYNLKAMWKLVVLVRLMRRKKFDIVHNWLFSANVFGTLAAKMAGTGIIVNSRRQAGYWNENPSRRYWNFVNNNSDLVIGNSIGVRSFIRSNEEIEENKLVVIPNGIESAPFKPMLGQLKKELAISGDSIVIAIVANLTDVKGHKYLFRVLRIISGELREIHLVCVGDGILKHKLKQLAEDLDLKARIHFLGRRENVEDILEDVDIGVLSSISEGMPNAILEYMRAGIPVVATDVGGVPDIVLHGVNGILVPPEDTAAMSEALIRLCQSPELREKYGSAGRRNIERKFSSHKMARAYEDVYAELISTDSIAESQIPEKFAYIISQFPSYDETFITREMKTLVDIGIDLTIFSLKPCTDHIIHADAKALLTRTRYAPFLSLANLSGMLYYAIKYPVRTVRCLSEIIMPAMVRPLNMLKLISVYPKICSYARTISKEGYSHIHAHWATVPTECAMLLTRLTKIPFSFTGHAHDIFLDNPMLRKKIREAKFVLTCTSDNKSHLAELFPDLDLSKVIVSYHGIDLKKYLLKSKRSKQDQNSAFQILGVGSLFECKGFEYLIRACAKLSKKGTNYHCRIIGGGRLFNKLTDLIHELDLQDHVELLGYMSQEEIVRHYQEADLFILPAIPEIHWGIPNVLLESLAVGTPFACTPLPALKELMDGRKCGYTIPEKDPDAIAHLVEQCLTNTDGLMKMGKEGRRRIEERFDIRRTAKQIKDILYEKAD